MTAVAINLGNLLNLKMVLYLQNLRIIETSRITNPKPRAAPEC